MPSVLFAEAYMACLEALIWVKTGHPTGEAGRVGGYVAEFGKAAKTPGPLTLDEQAGEEASVMRNTFAAPSTMTRVSLCNTVRLVKHNPSHVARSRKFRLEEVVVL